MLGQNSIEAYIQQSVQLLYTLIVIIIVIIIINNSMLSNRIKLILMENNVTDLIELLQSKL